MLNSSSNQIQQMFSSIASNYEKTNFWLSLGLCQHWNRQLVKKIYRKKNLLDLCAGTGAVGLSFLKNNPDACATLVDFCPEMVEIAKNKTTIPNNRLSIYQADCQELDFLNSSYDAISIAYGIRNLTNISRCFSHCKRLLQPGGNLYILELTRPSAWIVRFMHKIYLKFFVPFIGKICTKEPTAYRYLSSTVKEFTPPSEIKKQLEEHNFTVTVQPLNFGIATLFCATKMNNS